MYIGANDGAGVKTNTNKNVGMDVADAKANTGFILLRNVDVNAPDDTALPIA